MSIQRAASGRGHLLRRQQGGELVMGPGEPVPAFVEHLGDSTPARPARENALLVGGGCPAFALDRAQGGQGREVGADAADRA